MIDRALAIKRRLAVRSRFKTYWSLYWRRARGNVFGWGAAQDYLLDKKFDGWCGGVVQAPNSGLDACNTQSVHYWQLMKLFQEAPIGESDVLVDVGCGKGRVINYWLHIGCKNRIIGVELNERVADRTRERLKGYPNVTIITGNILDRILPDASLFFLYNPFHEPTMAKFKAVLLSTVRKKKELRVVYFNSVHRNLFDDDPDWDVQNFRSKIVVESVLIRPRDWDRGT